MVLWLNTLFVTGGLLHPIQKKTGLTQAQRETFENETTHGPFGAVALKSKRAVKREELFKRLTHPVRFSSGS